MYRVLLFSDSRYRDSFGSALVANKLRKLGVSVFVASYNYWQQAIDRLAPHMVVLNHIQGRRNKRIASHVKRHGGVVVVQFGEGIIEFSDKRKIFEAQRNHEHVDLFLCWNDLVASIVGGKSIGCPRFDIYGDEYSSLIQTRDFFAQKYNLDPERQIILFASSFPSAKFTYMKQDFHKNNWSDLGNTKADKWESAERFAKKQFDLQEEFKAAILAVKHQERDSQIVVKPHPMSDVMMWHQFCATNNLTLIDYGYVFDAINACDLLVTKLGSITVAEGWLMDKPVIKYGIDYNTASSREQFNVDGNNANNIAELLDIIPDVPMPDWAKAQEYQDRWGIAPINSGVTTAAELRALLESKEPRVNARIDIDGFDEVVTQHDNQHRGYTIDAYGNHNKAVRQWDIGYWNDQINALSQ